MPRNKKAVTITAIAKEVGLSVGAVSFVLSGQAKKRGIAPKTADLVRETATRLGYVPHYWAQSLQKKRTGLISVLFDSLEMNWAGRVMQGITGVLGQGDYTPVIGLYFKMPLLNEDISGIAHREILSILMRRDEGLICTPRIEVVEDYKILLKHGLRIIFIGGLLDEMEGLEGIHSVIWDCGPAAKKIVQHLISTGRKKIAFVGARHGHKSDMVRYNAYKETLCDAGIELDDNLVVWGPAFEVLPIEMIESLFKDTSNRPDAIFAMNDSIAITLLDMLEDLGINVPSEVAIAGMGDLPVTKVKSVGITTVSEPLEEIGRQASMLLMELNEDKHGGTVHLKIEGSDLKIRKTTAPSISL